MGSASIESERRMRSVVRVEWGRDRGKEILRGYHNCATGYVKTERWNDSHGVPYDVLQVFQS